MNRSIELEKERAPSVVWLALVAAVWLAALGYQPMPKAVGASEFDTAAARASLETICAGTRIGGNSFHANALAHLEARLRERGHVVERMAGQLGGVPLVNLVARSAGTASTGSVVLMAHHDSRAPDCPGASDDGMGTVAALECFLEVARAPHRNDLVLLLTDGEELGMLGATIFVERHPLMAGVRAVVNLESLGNGGPAWLFETGPEDGRWIAEFARTAPLPIGSSIAEPIYRTFMKHRNTDFTRFRDRGIGGFNFATVWGTSANHQAFDTPENMSLASLVHLGESGLAATRVLVAADLAAPPLPEPSFFELPGMGMVVIAPWLASAIAWLAAALGLAVVWRGVSKHGAGPVLLGVLGGLLALLLALGASLGATYELRWVVSLFGLEQVPTGNEVSMRYFAAGVGVFSAGVFGALQRVFTSRTEGFLVPWVLVAIWLEIVSPASSHQAALPLLAVALAALAPLGLRPLLGLAALSFAALFLGPLLRTLPQITSQMLTPATLAGALPGAGLAALVVVIFGGCLRGRPRLCLEVVAVGVVLLTAWAIGNAQGW